MAACDDFRASFGEYFPICWLCQALKERDAAREELGWKRLCPKCEEHYSDPNDLGECPVCETQKRNNSLSKMLQKIWDAAQQETGDWRDVGSYFTKLKKERDEARAAAIERGECTDRWHGEIRRVQRERDEARKHQQDKVHGLAQLWERILVTCQERDEALAELREWEASDDLRCKEQEQALRERNDLRERLQHAVEREEMWEAQRDEARAVAREYFEASLHEVVGRSCYAEVVEEAYVKYPFLKEMPLDP